MVISIWYTITLDCVALHLDWQYTFYEFPFLLCMIIGCLWGYDQSLGGESGRPVARLPGDVGKGISILQDFTVRLNY